MRNKLLQNARASIEAQIAPEYQDAYARLVTAGMQVAASNGLSILGGLEKRGDPIRDAAQGAVNLVFLLRLQATGRVPEQAMVFASYSLMLEALAFVEDAKIARIDEAALTKATHVWTNTVFARAKISPNMLRQGAERVNGILNDPTKLEMLNLATGYTKDPRTPQPMEMPAEPAPMNRRERRRARRARKRADAKESANVSA